MPIANTRTYLSDVIQELRLQWPDNHIINIVCHGHSVPAGYFATPMVDTFNAYPHLLFGLLKDRFPFTTLNMIVTAIGGEESDRGSKRFEEEVLCHRPAVLTIDYGLNDRRIGLAKAEESWRIMIEKSIQRQIKLLLLTPTPDTSGLDDPSSEQWSLLKQHAEQIRSLADEYQVGLVDSFLAFERYVQASGDLTLVLSWKNHPNRKGHELVADQMMRWFTITPT